MATTLSGKLDTLHTDLGTTLHTDLATTINAKLLANTASASCASVAISTSAVQVLASNSARIGCTLQNTGNQDTWYGFDSSVVPGNVASAHGGLLLRPGEQILPAYLAHYTGAIYCICDTGNSTFVAAGSW